LSSLNAWACSGIGGKKSRVLTRLFANRDHDLSKAGHRRHLDKSCPGNYPCFMNIVRRTLDIDTDTDARLQQMASERGEDVAVILAEAIALLDSVVDITGPDVGEDRRRP
jgi:hypothetical protein